MSRENPTTLTVEEETQIAISEGLASPVPFHSVDDSHNEERRVKPFELFFDLVFVFGFTQVTTMMSHDTSWLHLAQGMVILAAIWWTWGGYTWLATVIDLEEGATRIIMLGIMAAMFIVALSAPEAFGDHPLLFGITYQVVRALHIVLMAILGWGDKRLLQAILGMTPTSIIAPAIVTYALWKFDGTTGLAVFAAAMLLDYSGPLFSPTDGWRLTADHFTERHGLIVLIAIGESLIAVGAALDSHLTWRAIGGALLGMVIVSAFWWMYFDVVALVAARKLASLQGRAQNALARDSYSYLHFPMVAGIILFALGVKLTLEHPTQYLDNVAAFALLGGVALYLLGHLMFRYRNVRTLNKQRLIAALVLGALYPMHAQVHALTMLTWVAVLMTALIAYEAIRFAEMRYKIRHYHPN